MGVHGLTTYINEHSAALAKTLHFATDVAPSEPTTFVIDAWSFIYEVLAWAGLPWVYGGEYNQFAEFVIKIVKAWLGVGLRLYFVFDGPFPEIKFPTIISRMNRSTIKPSHLFFRTSATSRATPRFLRESVMLPPGMYAACVETLQGIARNLGSDQVLEIHFADEEGDPYAVELAARLGGYVVGNDSDFVILNAEGYCGYVPLALMAWSSLDSEDDDDAGDAEEDGFQTVVSKGKKKTATQKSSVSRGIVPPDVASGLQLSVIIYSPATLATHLQLPISLLPLLGALVGNDFTGEREASATTSQETNLQWLFFERSLTLTQRITRVATTLRTILSAALGAGRNKNKHAVHSVMQLIERAVNALIVRSVDSMASGEKERVVERVVEATLQYAIPRYEGTLLGTEGLWAEGVCALHDATSCPLLRYLASPSDPLDDDVEAQRERVRVAYVAAYRIGRLDPHTLDVMHSGTFWYRQFLENPDLENVARSIGRPIQLWTYALLDDALGLPARTEPEPEPPQPAEENAPEQDDEDELIDVVEEDSEEDADPLAPLRGALQQLNGFEEGTLDGAKSETTATASNPASPKARSKVVEEYVRRGTKLASEDVIVPPLSELLASLPNHNQTRFNTPIQLLPPEDRFAFFLKALQSDSTLIRSLPADQRTAALVLRWVVRQLHARFQERGHDKTREKEKWTQVEARAFLASFSFSSPTTLTGEQDEPEQVPIVDRNVQLTAQVSVTLDCIMRLGEVLLLNDELLSPVLRFSGRRFHAYLTGTKVLAVDAIPERLWRASNDGLESAFIEPAGKKKRKDKKEAVKSSPVGNKAKAGAGFGSKFGLLADIDA
ncbi:uncharacterized protein PHACADRAFT_211158 [Phanerochaete carnosa HHB-10118-sp]|uniref:Asteroid domain-containing protein n=1 Tax=Phanerochaete carnosa (strain HHB-10118-sp) TaxID=650164 RepID=K5W2V7_PHACS|nr:uncharacterized protein PHACADRAFT_211158 [Phanerochaete carnosa HHB-10118-sp]EKM53460.1 hypothetical protein PHACADRAFT_211158 [Phanerochaete carnosa HHB-10118-sp]